MIKSTIISIVVVALICHTKPVQSKATDPSAFNDFFKMGSDGTKAALAGMNVGLNHVGEAFGVLAENIGLGAKTLVNSFFEHPLESSKPHAPPSDSSNPKDSPKADAAKPMDTSEGTDASKQNDTPKP